MMRWDRLTWVSAGLLATIASAGQAAAQAQPRGVACVFATLSEPVRNALVGTLANENSSAAELEARRVEMQPAVQTCTRSEGWTQREQQELSFSFAFHAAQLLGVGNRLQALGVNPAAVEALYSSLPPALTARLVQPRLSDAESRELTDGMRQFLSSNGPARQAPARGLAFEFLRYVALMHDVQRRFSAVR